MKLSEIQQVLKVPKNQFNKFGGYNYRNAEDILEAVKPLLGDSILTLSDEVVCVGNRNYVKATARFMEDEDVGEPGSMMWRAKVREVTAYACEAAERKGMDSSQITGAASSYARKYALNGLFLIDDTKDADSEEKEEEPNWIKLLNDAPSLEALKYIWGTVPQEKRAQYEDLKNALKDKFTIGTV